MLRVAVAEDNPKDRERLLSFLKKYGEEKDVQIEVAEYTDGSELLDQYRPCYDVIFLDVEMPQMDGMKAAEKIRETDEEVIPQEADRHHEAVRRRYYDTTEIEVLPRYLCRSDGKIRAAKGHRRLEGSSQVHAAVLSGYTETLRRPQSGSGGFAAAERNGTGRTKTGEKRNTDREAERGGNRRSRQHRRECRFSFRQ